MDITLFDGLRIIVWTRGKVLAEPTDIGEQKPSKNVRNKDGNDKFAFGRKQGFKRGGDHI